MKKLLRLMLVWGLILSVFSSMHSILPVQARMDPTVVDISTAEQLTVIRNDLSGSYRLTANIDLSSIANWTPLGDETTPFTGSLDGGNYAVRNLVLANTQTVNQGLFGVIGAGGSVSSLKIENATVTAADFAGILAGVNRGTLSRVSAQGIVTGGTVVGGLVGDNYGAISDSFAVATVSGRDKNGGLVGSNNNGGSLTNTYAASKVAGAVTNNYIQFSGDDYISIPHNPAYVTDSFTLEAWFQWTPGANRASVDFITGKGLENFEIHTGDGTGLTGANGIRFIPVYRPLTSYNDGRAYQDVPNVLQPGWNHVAAVWDFANKKAMVLLNGIPQNIYQKGAIVGTQASIPLLNPNSNPLGNNTNAFFIGARNDNGGQPFMNFHGSIADVRFWKTVRTPAQISADKFKQLTGNETNLIGYWKLDETSGAVVGDSSALHNNGTILGTPTRVQEASTNGGLVGFNTGTITSSYYDSTVSGLNDANGTGLSTAQMRQQSSFAGWGFSASEWKISEGYTYPTPFTYTVPVSFTSVAPSPAVYGQTYTASFSTAQHYLGIPTGSVTVSDGDGESCSAALTPGSPSTGSCSLSSNAGSKTLTASFTGDSIFNPSEGSGSQTVNKANQSALSITVPASLIYGGTAALGAAGGTGTGGITYSTGASTGCSVSGATLSVTNASGTCLVTATRAADTNYNEVSSTPAGVTLIKADQAALTITAPDSLAFDSTAQLSTTGGNGTGGVTYSTGDSTGCFVIGTFLTVMDLSGTCSVSAVKAADSNYNAVSSDAVDVTLVKGEQAALTLIAPPMLIYGDTADLSFVGGSGAGSITYSTTGSTGCSVSGATLSVLDASGTCSATVTQAADTNYNEATSGAVDVTLVKADQAFFSLSSPASLTYGTTAELSTTGGSGTGLVTYSAGASTGCSITDATLSVTNVSGTCSIYATQAADNNYNEASAFVDVTLIKAYQAALILDAPTSLTYGNTAELSTTGGSGTGGVTYSTGGSTGCAVSGTTLSVTDVSGTCSVTATQAADTNYNTVSSDAADVTLIKGEQAALILTAPASIPYGSTATLSSFGGSGTGGVTYSASGSTGCSVSGNTLSVTNASGTCSVTATRAADNNYNEVSSDAASVTLVKAEQSALSITAPASLTYGSTAGLSASGGSGTGSVAFSTGDSTGCSITDTTLSVTDASGTCSVTAARSADMNYNAVSSTSAGVTLVKAGQLALTLTAPASLTYGSTAALSTMGGSGTGGVTYSSEDSTGCSVSGATLSVTDASGACSVTATQAADNNYNAVSSDAASVTLVKDSSSTTITSDTSDPSMFGEDYTISVIVTSLSGTPTGTVAVNNGSGADCTITLTDGAGSCELTSTGVGDITLTAAYSGDHNFSPSDDTEEHSGIRGSTQVTLADLLPDPASLGEAVTFSITVDPAAPALGVPTGTVDVLLDSAVLCSGTLSDGQASCGYSGFTAGTHTLTAHYNGDANFDGSVSAGVNHAVHLIALDDHQTSTNFTSVGHLTTSGGSAPYTYRLQTSGRICTLSNGAGNAGFTISGNVLQRKSTTGSGTYNLCVESEDSTGGAVQKAFSVLINDPPMLSSGSLSRLTVGIPGTEISRLTVTGGRAPFTYGLAAAGAACTAQNSSGNASFIFSNDMLSRRAASPAGIYPICVQVRDIEGDTAQQAYTITVTDRPEALALSRVTVSTKQTEVGSFSVKNGLAPLTYSLQTSGAVCSITNGADNGSFAVSNSRLERRSGTVSGAYSICAQAKDSNGMVTQASFTITVAPPPAELKLSSQTVKTSQELVGTLSTVSGLFPYTYSLKTSGTACSAGHAAANALFEVEGSGLKRQSSAAAGTYNVCLQTSDANGEVTQKVFAITVAPDAPPPPAWNVELTANQIIESDPKGTVVGSLVSNRAGITYTLVDRTAFPLADHFSINSNGELILANTLTPGIRSTFPIRIRAAAPNGETKDVDGVITVMKNGIPSGAAAGNDTGNLKEGGRLRVDVLGNDRMTSKASAWVSMQIVRYPRNGSAEIGSIIYTPKPGFYGTDTVTYRACDNLGYCVTGTATFTVDRVENKTYLPLFFH